MPLSRGIQKEWMTSRLVPRISTIMTGEGGAGASVIHFWVVGVKLLAVDEALERLTKLDPQQARVVELRFFGGLTIEETASALAVSPATVKRQWTVAKAWLRREVTDAVAGSDGSESDRGS